MITRLFSKLSGSKNERELSRIRPVVARINDLEQSLLSEPAGKAVELTCSWREDLARYHPLLVPSRQELEGMDAERIGSLARVVESRLSLLRKEFPALPHEVSGSVASLENAVDAFQALEPSFAKSRERYLERILPHAYAVVKNAARRLCGTEIPSGGGKLVWNMVHFDVQLAGGVALHKGMIAEMQTGEGKTLVATLPVYLNALAGLGVHVVTVNDYLAARDSEWMGALFGSLGLSVGCIRSGMTPKERHHAYACDITYGTSSEFGFDYLRDNGLALSRAERVQRGRYFAIIDEIDSILIDEARTPLIISGPAGAPGNDPVKLAPAVDRLVRHQTELCNGLAAAAIGLREKGDVEGAGLALFKLKLGQPWNRRFLRFMEEPELRRLLERTELAFQRGAFQKDIVKLKEELYYAVDEKAREVDLMEKGRVFLSPDDPHAFTVPDSEALLRRAGSDPRLDRGQRAEIAEEILRLRDKRAGDLHAISQLLKAYCLFEKDVHYVVREGEVVIIDESTGREMSGRRWPDGLHQAVEAKEGVAVGKETRTCATITLQNYFRLYEKLAGMTGTAETEAAEFHDIYRLDVLPIPPNAPNLRTDAGDRVFRTRREKLNAVVAGIETAHRNGRPVLVGSGSVEVSETLSRLLRRAGIPHSVLNAKNHREEAGIVALAGRKGAVTVSTNMAGRGTDIKLGEGVAELGGLLVIGTERSTSRRVDRQLRGRCSRQGDPGTSAFFLSLEDDLMRNHAAPGRMAALLEQYLSGKGGTLRGGTLGKLVESAQKDVGERDYKSRKRILDFDDVMNLQREIVYDYRNEVMDSGNMRAFVDAMLGDAVGDAVRGHLAGCDPYEPDHSPLLDWLSSVVSVAIAPEELEDRDGEEAVSAVIAAARRYGKVLMAGHPREAVDEAARQLVLGAVDRNWQEHLENMDGLREGVFLRSQGQKDPLVEYKNEACALFRTLMDTIRTDAVRNIFRYFGNAAASPGTVKQFEETI